MKQETSKHTATPWMIKDKDFEHGFIVNSQDLRVQEIICSCYGNSTISVPNAEFIVRACNAHEDMLDFIKKLYNAENADIFNQIFTFAGDIISKAEGKQ